METNVNYTIVGAFVILLISAFTLTIIWLSAGFSFEKYDIYKVYMDESVSGLNIDSPVEFNGVQVGKVTKIKIDLKNPKLVRVLLRVKHNTPVTKSTVAMLTTRGITGYVYFSLIDKGIDHSPLTLQPGERYPVIPSQPSIFTRLDKALTQISNSFVHIDDALTNLLSRDNLEMLKEILFSMRRVANTLANNSENIDSIIKNTKSASKQFSPLLQSGQGAMQMLQTQTLPAANQALTNFEATAQMLNQFAVELKQNPSVLIRGRAPATPGPGEN